MDDVSTPQMDAVTKEVFTFGEGIGIATTLIENVYDLSTSDAMALLLAAMLIAAVEHPEWAQAWNAMFDPDGVLRQRVAPLLISCLALEVMDTKEDDDGDDTGE